MIAVLFPKSQNNCNNATEDMNNPIIPLPSAPRYLDTRMTVTSPMAATNTFDTKLDNMPFAKAVNYVY